MSAQARQSDYAIETHGLTRDFATVRAVDNLTLAAPVGAVFGFLGANGAGKTTTIHLLLGLIQPTAGSASVLGYDTRAQHQEIRERCGALLEFSGLYERLTAEQNLEFFGRVWRLTPAERQARAKELLSHFGLWDRRTERVGAWSRGMKQKLAIARVLLHRPQVIFLDEPTAGLDPVAAAALRDDLAALAAREGVTVFLNTHNLDEAQRLCTHVAVIRQGRLLALGSPDELRQQTGAPQLEVICDGVAPAAVTAVRALPEVSGVETQPGKLLVRLREGARGAPVVSALVAAGAQVEEVRRGAASLEEAFLSLMQEERA